MKPKEKTKPKGNQKTKPKTKEKHCEETGEEISDSGIEVNDDSFEIMKYVPDGSNNIFCQNNIVILVKDAH